MLDAPNQVLMDSMGTVLTTFDMVTDAEGGLRLVQSFANDGGAGAGAGGGAQSGRLGAWRHKLVGIKSLL